MYSVYGDGVCIYNDLYLTGAIKALTPKLTISDNAAGSLEITLPVGNAGYDTLKRMKSVITVYRNKEELWSGRIISEKMDFRNNRVLTCEGELAYLNDTIQPPKRYAVSNDPEDVSFGNGVTVLEFLESILTLHNQNVDEEKRFYADKSYIFNWNETMPVVCTNYENTLDCINENLITRYGGHLRIRKENGKRYLDWFKEEINTNTQVIRFGQNLLDFTKNWDLSELATVIIPRGARLEESAVSEDITAYVTVENAELDSDDIPKDENGNAAITHQGVYVIANAPKDTYGWIEKTVDFEDVTDPTELLKKAIEYLKETQFDDLSLEVSAVDLHYLNVEAESIRILDLIRCISRPHGLDKLFPVSELSIQLDKPDSAEYTLGTMESGKNLSSSVNSSNADINREIENLPTKQSILTKAKENADLLIKETTNGFVTLVTDEEGGRHSEALVISSEKDYTKAAHYWIWNVNGLAHYSKSTDDGKDVNELNVAITMDGAIVADYITTGTMSADRIRTGVLTSQDGNVVWNLNNSKYYPDENDTNNYYEAGSLTIKRGSIALGEPFGNWKGSFCVDNEGVMVASKGYIGGFTITSDEIYNDVMRLESYGLSFQYKNTDDS
ncbi:MAG: phage tail protein, partial [bacterium]|nr:phage tail protein [bacterium]